MKLIEAVEVQVEFKDIRTTHFENIACHLGQSLLRGGERSAGYHVSGIIGYHWFGRIPEESPVREKKLKEFAEDVGDSSVMPLRMCMGMAWELYASGLYSEMVWQPGEIVKDGIAGSLDGLSEALPTGQILTGMKFAQRRELTVEEFKLTYKSYRNREILKETLWIWQLMAYCVLARTRWARLHVLWVNGDYSFKETGGPKYFRYLIQFEEFELRRFWEQVMLKGKEELEALGV